VEGEVVFVIGRPGSGKSAVIQSSIKVITGEEPNLKVASIGDYSYLSRLFKDPLVRGLKYMPCEEGGYLVLDPTVFDEALSDLCNRAKTLARSNDIVFCEFARSSYVKAFDLLARQGCVAEIALYVAASYELCLQRNERRREANGHFVSKEEMARTYRHDDIEALERGPIHVHELINEKEGDDQIRDLGTRVDLILLR